MSDADRLNQLLNDLNASDPRRRRRAALQIGMLHNPIVVPDLLRAADDSDDGVRSLIASALASIGQPAVDGVRGALTHESHYVRQTAVSALRHMDDAALVGDIIPLLDDPSAQVQEAAQAALEAYNTPEARAALSAWQNRD